jgi:ATP-dependent DNA helicase RecG
VESPAGDTQAALAGNPHALPSNPGGLSSKLGGLPSNPSLPPAASPPARFDEAARHALQDGLPGSLAARLGAIGQRHPPQEIQNLVVELCTPRAWKTDELSLVLRRNAEVVRQSDLRRLMREGRLAMTRPEEPNDPQQAYRAVDGQLQPSSSRGRWSKDSWTTRPTTCCAGTARPPRTARS